MLEYLRKSRSAVIGGDFDVGAEEWGSRFTNARGYTLLEALAKVEAGLCNKTAEELTDALVKACDATKSMKLEPGQH